MYFREKTLAMSPPLATTRIAGLDGVRAIAVTAVVWHHSHSGFSWLAFSRNGFLGVDLFFVLSGFLITNLLLIENSRTGEISLIKFYARRALRIFPLYFAVLIALTFAFVFLADTDSQLRTAFLRELPFHASYTSNWIESKTFLAITWSLSTEEQFYMFWPPLLMWLGRRSVYALGAMLFANQLVNFGPLDGWLSDVGLPYSSLHILQCTFSPILFGCCAAFVIRGGESPTTKALDRHGSSVLVTAAAAMIIAASWPGDIRGFPRLAFQLAATLFVAALVYQPRHSFVRILESRLLVYIGTISYGIYLLHIVAIEAARPLARMRGEGEGWTLFLAAFCLSVALAALSFRFFESPILRLKQRFTA